MNEERIKISINEEDVQNIIDCYEKDIKYIEALDKENKQLKHILDELEKWLEEIQQEEFDINGFTGVCTEIRIQCILDKIKELRGDKNV